MNIHTASSLFDSAPRSKASPILRRLEADPVFSIVLGLTLHFVLLGFAKVQIWNRLSPLVPAPSLQAARWGFYAALGIDALSDLALYTTLWLTLACTAKAVWNRGGATKLLGGLALTLVPLGVWSLITAFTVKFALPPVAEAAATILSPSAAQEVIHAELSSSTLGRLVASRPAAYILGLPIAAEVFSRSAGLSRGRAAAVTGAYLVVVAGLALGSGILLGK